MRLCDTIIKGGNVVTPAGSFVGDIGIKGEKISALGEDLDTSGAKVIDARGHHVIPGVLDVHVHLELPFCGTVSADDYRSGTRAGARGGVTTVIDFAIPSAERVAVRSRRHVDEESGREVAHRLHVPHLHHALQRAQVADQRHDRSRLHDVQRVHDLRVGGLAVGRPRALRHARERCASTAACCSCTPSRRACSTS